MLLKTVIMESEVTEILISQKFITKDVEIIRHLRKK